MAFEMKSSQETYRSERLPLRTANTDYVITTLSTLLSLAATVDFTPEYTSNEKLARRLAKHATQKKTAFNGHIKNIQFSFDVILPQNSSGIRTECITKMHTKNASRNITLFNIEMNWLNTMSVNLRRSAASAASGTTSEFDKFVLSHAFPTYNNHHGFQSQTDAELHIQRIEHPHMPVVIAHIDDSEFDLSKPDDTTSYASALKLKCSRRRVIVATPIDASGSHLEFFSNTLNYGIRNAELHEIGGLNEFRYVERAKITRFSSDPKLNLGTFGGFALKLKFPGDITIVSNSKEIALRMPTDEARVAFDQACKRKIIELFSARDPTKSYNEILVFCRHPGCSHGDGFIHNYSPKTILERLQMRPECPEGHAFCVACRQDAHSGLCQDIDDAERRALLKMSGINVCPTCKTPIEKIAGCNHMQCDRCKQNFCWTCGMTFSHSEGYVQHDGCNQFS